MEGFGVGVSDQLVGSWDIGLCVLLGLQEPGNRANQQTFFLVFFHGFPTSFSVPSFRSFRCKLYFKPSATTRVCFGIVIHEVLV